MTFYSLDTVHVSLSKYCKLIFCEFDTEFLVFATLCSPFSVEFKVTIVITFQSELSKSYTKFDPKTPKSWVSMQRTYSSLFTLPCTNIICTGFSLRWKVCHWNWSAQNETILRRYGFFIFLFGLEYN